MRYNIEISSFQPQKAQGLQRNRKMWSTHKNKINLQKPSRENLVIRIKNINFKTPVVNMLKEL